MGKKIPIISSSLRFRLWIIIVLASLFIMFSTLSGSFVELLTKIGINTGEKGVLAIGMVVILLISISGLVMLEKAFYASKKEDETDEPSAEARADQEKSEFVHKLLNEKLNDLQKKLDQVSQNTHSLSGDNETLARLAAKDGLTGLYNHAFINERLKQEIYRSQRYNHQMSLLMIDIDDFKSVNDTHGHSFGDRVLKNISTLMQQMIRPSDILGRYGGEEFLIILPQTSSEHSLAVAERIRTAVEFHDFKMLPSQNRDSQITISIGVCTFLGNGQTAKDLVVSADESLYFAKRDGKNRVKVYESINPN
jgi:diguanylate cyclase (GGDEF)-like protein